MSVREASRTGSWGAWWKAPSSGCTVGLKACASKCSIQQAADALLRHLLDGSLQVRHALDAERRGGRRPAFVGLGPRNHSTQDLGGG